MDLKVERIYLEERRSRSSLREKELSMKMRTILTLITMVVLISAPIFAGGQGEDATTDGPVELRFWALMSGADGEVLERMVNQFNEEQSGIVVQFEISVWEAYYQQLTA